jgi:hypothetical protein
MKRMLITGFVFVFIMMSSLTMETSLNANANISESLSEIEIHNTLFLDRLSFTEDPNFGSVSLSADFEPDPHVKAVTSGGAVDVSYLGGECTGFASKAPDYRINWSGTTSEFRVIFEAANETDDTTLIINKADGSWSCNDDANADTLNPMVIIKNPVAGQYDVWVGSYSKGENIVGTLYVTEYDVSP